jgi:dual-specificity kinase
MAKGRKWDEKVDIWSFGCIMMELYTGELLFNTHDTVEHFMLIEKLLGVKIFKNREKLLDNDYVQEQPPLCDLIKENDYKFLDFIKNCLEIYPENRWSACELLNHEYLLF